MPESRGRLLCDVPVHDLGAGDKQLLQKSRNAAYYHAASWAHLKNNLRLFEGCRYVLLGKNGCGKTTLLRTIATGSLTGWPAGATTYLVDQELSLDLQRTPLEIVIAADSQGAALEKEAAALEAEAAAAAAADEAEAAEIAEKLCAIYEELEQLGAEDEGVKNRRATAILGGLGFNEAMLASKVASLSGGWRVRVALAAALFMAPAVLLLDEPTNHLDIQGIQWLQSYLANVYRGTVLCVSHDRAFIDAIATDIISMADQSLNYFVGNISEMDEAASAKAKGVQRQVAALEKKKEHVKDSIQKMQQAAAGKNGDQKKSKQAASRINKLGLMGLEKTADGHKYSLMRHGLRTGAANENDGDGPRKAGTQQNLVAAPIIKSADPDVKFNFPTAAPLGALEGQPVLEFRKVAYCYPGSHQAALEHLELSLFAQCRLCIMGRNGAGKSTLMGLLSGALTTTSGEVRSHRNLKIATFGQHEVEALQKEHGTALSHLQELCPSMKEQDLRAKLGAFGIKGAAVMQDLSSLSGGQRARVIFAKICVEAPHLLVLDEPTNHLDIYSIDALTEALQCFKGGAVIISHNQNLLRAVGHQVGVVSKRGLKMLDGSIHEYLDMLASKPREPGG